MCAQIEGIFFCIGFESTSWMQLFDPNPLSLLGVSHFYAIVLNEFFFYIERFTNRFELFNFLRSVFLCFSNGIVRVAFFLTIWI